MEPSATRVAVRHLASGGLRRDYGAVMRGEMDAGVFAKQHHLKMISRLPQGSLAYYDCGGHAQLRTDKTFGRSRWRLGAEISWSDAKVGDWVEYDGWHHGVVINPNRKLVESCWGVEGVVFQHPVNVSPYRNPRVQQIVPHA